MHVNQRKFRELLEEFSTVILLTHVTHADTATRTDLNARPMTIAKLEPNCDLWLITGADTETVRDVAHNSHVHVTAQDGRDTFLSVWGHARVVQDASKVRELWKEAYKAWFPQGKDDPSIRLIHIRTTAGEYWDTHGVNKVRYLFEAAKAYMTGTTPETHDDDLHGTVEL